MSNFSTAINGIVTLIGKQARGVVIVGITLILLILLALGYEQVQRQAEIDLENLNTALEARLDEGLLSPLEHRLSLIAGGLKGYQLNSGVLSDGQRLKDWLSRFSDVEEVTIADDAGHIVYPSFKPENEYRQMLSTGQFLPASVTTEARLAVDSPHRLVLAVPIKEETGRLNGWVIASVSLDSIRNLLSDVSLGANGVVTLRLASSPRTILRIPSAHQEIKLTPDLVDEAILSGIDHGTLRMKSRVDGVSRLYGFTRIGSYQLVLLTGAAVSEYLYNWYWTVGTSLSLTFALFLWLHRSARSLDKARLRESSVLAELQGSVEKTNLILNSVGQSIVGIDTVGNCVFCNPAGLALLGVDPEAFVGKSINPYFCSSLQDYCDLTIGILGTIRKGEVYHGVSDNFLDAAGINRPVEVFAYPNLSGGVVIGAVLVLNDISERREHERSMQYLAYHDSLTGLANRHGFSNFIDSKISASVGHVGKVSSFAFAYIDIDGFRHINDSLGPSFGDSLLIEVAARLGNHEHVEFVSRISGDLFVAVIPGAHNAHGVAVELQGLMRHPWYNGLEIPTSVCIGIATFPEDGGTLEAIRIAADIALNNAKQLGRSTIRLYDKPLGEASARRFELQNLLTSAVARGEICVHYQPKIDCLKGEVYGAEALLRWEHPELGKISPAEFIPIAETSGQIVPITEWLVNEVCGQIADWKESGLPDMQVSVNCSALQFKHGDILAAVCRSIATHSISSSLLELELTESALIEDSELIVETLTKFRQMGVKLSIDDFGTGYSNLVYLKRFNVNTLKIDRSFVSKLPEDSESALIVQAILSLADELNLEVVAEGVETEWSLAYLSKLKCSKIQGFYFSPALLPQDFTEYAHDFTYQAVVA